MSHDPPRAFGLCVWQVSGFQSTPVGTGPGAPATSDDMAQSTYFAAVGLTLSSVRGCVCVQPYFGTSTLITQKWSCLVGALLAYTDPRTPEHCSTRVREGYDAELEGVVLAYVCDAVFFVSRAGVIWQRGPVGPQQGPDVGWHAGVQRRTAGSTPSCPSLLWSPASTSQHPLQCTGYVVPSGVSAAAAFRPDVFNQFAIMGKVSCYVARSLPLPLLRFGPMCSISCIFWIVYGSTC